MKKAIQFMLIAIFSQPLMTVYGDNPPMPDPSAAYAVFLGYKVETRKNPNGAEHGVCIFPDGSECDTWDFFRGVCGQKYSYCSIKGCETRAITENRGSYTSKYCACACLDSTGKRIVTPLMDFMEQHGDTLIKRRP
jgi:putative hemolysin